MQKIKNAIKGHREKKEFEREGHFHTHETTSEVPVAVGVAEVPVVVTEEQRVLEGGAAGIARQGKEICGQKVFTEVEDRPVVKERVERYVEHHPVEKQYVVETKFVGERAAATGAHVEHLGGTEYVVEAAEPGPKCPTSAGRMMDQAAGRTL